MNDFELVKKFFTDRDFAFEIYISPQQNEKAIVFDCEKRKYQIGYVSHAMHFNYAGKLYRLSNWDYDHDDIGYEKYKPKKHDKQNGEDFGHDLAMMLGETLSKTMLPKPSKDIDYHEKKILNDPQIQVDGHVFPKSWLVDFIKGGDDIPMLLLRVIAMDWLRGLED